MNTVDDGESTLMLDCGLRWPKVSALLKGHATDVEAAFITHSHGDHSCGVKDALHHGLDCWMSIETAQALQAEGARRIGDGERVHIGTWSVDAFSTVHDCPGSLGFIAKNQVGEKLLYVTDSAYVPRKIEGLSIIAIEANYSLPLLKDKVHSGQVDPSVKHRILWNHQSIATVTRFLQETDKTKLQAVYLLHLSDNNSDEQDFKKRVAEIVGCPVFVA